MHPNRYTKYWRYFATTLLTILMYKLIFLERSSINCYDKEGETLPDISDIAPRKGKSIFFFETSCKSMSEGKITINARQACAVESAAKMDPNFDVYLLYTSPGVFKFDGEESDELLQSLLSYKNVKIMHLDFGRYVEGTPVESIYSSGMLQRSKFAVSHASDVLRYLTLWKYGGIYLDLDVIVIKSLEDLPANYAGLQGLSETAAGVLSFDASERGHAMAHKCLLNLQHGFNGNKWGRNGPVIIDKLVRDLCNINDTEIIITGGLEKRECNGFTIYPPHVFYPIFYSVWDWYFNSSFLRSTIFATKNTYVIHFWNSLSKSTKLSIDSNVAYLHFARKYCPKVIEKCQNEF